MAAVKATRAGERTSSGVATARRPGSARPVSVRPMIAAADRPAERVWTFLTNHAHVLLALADDPDMRLRDIAGRVGITERATQIIVGDLEREGYLVKERVGRRNRYTLVPGRHFRHPAEAGHSVDALVQIFSSH